jgi:hypothetical protein
MLAQCTRKALNIHNLFMHSGNSITCGNACFPVKLVVVDSWFFPPDRHVRQAYLTLESLRQGPVNSPGEHKSSPRPGSRDGMKQEPYEPRMRRALRCQRVRRRMRFAYITPFPGFKNFAVSRSRRDFVARPFRSRA